MMAIRIVVAIYLQYVLLHNLNLLTFLYVWRSHMIKHRVTVRADIRQKILHEPAKGNSESHDGVAVSIYSG
jgi:hypothetical protein